MLMREIPITERPRERLAQFGPSSLSNEELISLILRCGTKDKSIKELALDILKKIDKIENLKDMTLNKILEIKGVGLTKGSQLISVVELGKRIYFSSSIKNRQLKCSKDVYEEIKDIFNDKNQELFYCLYFNNKQELIDKKLLFLGTVNRSLVHPREIFKYAYLYSATSIICIHNHPSGDVKPSLEDMELTQMLFRIGEIQKIPIIDHIIIGNNKYYSFKDNSKLYERR